MEEKIIIKSINNYKNTILKFTILFLVVASISWIVFLGSESQRDEAYENYRVVEKHYGYNEAQKYYDEYSALGDIEEISMVSSFITAPIAIVLLVFYVCISKMQVVVTNKRVYGKTSFGKQVDLPLDSISAVGINAFSGIAVGTSSGSIKFLGISNRDEVYEAIRKILADRQEKEIKIKTPIANISQEQSSADELKKFKTLLDSGIITQEEFEAKKKQLLGL